MRPVVVDTNALLLPFTDGTDLHGEAERLLGAVEFLVPASVLVELALLADGAGATARAAKGALRLVQDWPVVATGLAGDDGVLDVARRAEAAVISNDKRLAGECRRAGLTVLRSRGPGRLDST